MGTFGGMDASDGNRWYGQYYRRTADLSLAEIAAMIIAELAAIKYDPDTDTVFPARIRYAADVDPRHDTITVAVFGLTDDEIANPDDRPNDDSPTPNDYAAIVEIVGTEYGWGDIDDAANRRFRVRATTLPESEQRAAQHRIGTVSAPAD